MFYSSHKPHTTFFKLRIPNHQLECWLHLFPPHLIFNVLKLVYKVYCMKSVIVIIMFLVIFLFITLSLNVSVNLTKEGFTSPCFENEFGAWGKLCQSNLDQILGSVNMYKTKWIFISNLSTFLRKITFTLKACLD